MQTETIEIREAQDHLRELLDKILKTGNQIILSDNEKPVARLVPVSGRVPDLHAGAIWTSDDFDNPLSDDFWAEDQ